MLKANPETVLKEVTINQKYPHLANVLTLNSKTQAAYQEHTCKHTHTQTDRDILDVAVGKKCWVESPLSRKGTFNFYFNFCLI